MYSLCLYPLSTSPFSFLSPSFLFTFLFKIFSITYIRYPVPYLLGRYKFFMSISKSVICLSICCGLLQLSSFLYACLPFIWSFSWCISCIIHCWLIYLLLYYHGMCLPRRHQQALICSLVSLCMSSFQPDLKQTVNILCTLETDSIVLPPTTCTNLPQLGSPSQPR